MDSEIVDIGSTRVKCGCRCVVPVLVESRRKKLPFGLRALKAVTDIVTGHSLAERCRSNSHWRPTESDVDPLFLDNMTQLLNDRLHLKISREEAQEKKRGMWRKKEQMRRFVKREREKLEEAETMKRLQQSFERQLNAPKVIHNHRINMTTVSLSRSELLVMVFVNSHCDKQCLYNCNCEGSSTTTDINERNQVNRHDTPHWEFVNYVPDTDMKRDKLQHTFL